MAKGGFASAMAAGEAADQEIAGIASKGTAPTALPAEKPALVASVAVIQAPTPPVASEPVKAEPAKAAEVDKDKVIDALQNALSEAKRQLGLEKSATGRLADQAKDNKELKEQIKHLTDKIATLEKEKSVAPTTHPQATKIQALMEQFGLDETSATAFNKMQADDISAGVQATLEAMGIKPGIHAAAPIAAEPAAPVNPSAPSEETPTLSDASWPVFYSLVPDFSAIANVDTQGNAQFSPELKAYFASKVSPHTDVTFGQLAYNATITDDPVRLAAIYNEFKKTMASNGRPVRPIAPNTSGGGGKVATGDKPTYSLAEANRFRKEYQSKIGTYSLEELAKAKEILDEYDAAEFEGRLI